MKLEDLLVQQSEQQQMEQSHGEKMKKFHLEEEVVKLQEELDGEQALNKVLQCALQGPVVSHPCLATPLPPQVQELLAEMAMAEEEIWGLERKIEVLKFSLHEEKKQTQEWQMQQEQQFRQRHQNHLLCGQDDRSVLHDTCNHLSTSQNYDHLKRGKTRSYRRASVGSASDIMSMSTAGSRAEETHEVSRKQTRPRNNCPVHKEIGNDNPNELSEELIRCLIGIFLELNQATQIGEGSATIPKLGLSCMKSRGLTSKNLINHKAFLSPFNQHLSNPDPYSIMTDVDGSIRDIGAYKNFIQITRSSLDISQFSVFDAKLMQCGPDILEASVGVTSKRKIIVPKLLQWHMQDFADDMESLLEWIYSQLPRSGSLKRLIMECLNGETRYSTTKMVEVQQYESEFRYLLPL